MPVTSCHYVDSTLSRRAGVLHKYAISSDLRNVPFRFQSETTSPSKPQASDGADLSIVHDVHCMGTCTIVATMGVLQKKTGAVDYTSTVVLLVQVMCKNIAPVMMFGYSHLSLDCMDA